MIAVEEAQARIAAAFRPTGVEAIAIGDGAGRVLAQDARAGLSQPPFPVSAMDGYAVHADDVRDVPVRLRIAGSSPAGNPYYSHLKSGEAVRIFTGGVVPDGADAIVIQEDTAIEDGFVTVQAAPRIGQHIRVAGLDFSAGQILVPKGKRLTARDLSLLAAGDIADIKVRRRPRIGFVATGDELSRPGEPHPPGGIVASSGYGLSAMIAQWGGEAADLGLLPDRIVAFARLPEAARNLDLLITLGGASVGDHDLVQKALQPHGFRLDFWKIAMRPGKPLIFGHLGETPMLGLPGNPVSTFVCAMLFVRAAIAAMLDTAIEQPLHKAKLERGLPQNDARQDYIRARTIMRDGMLCVEPFAVQDSSMLSVFAAAGALIVRPPHAPAMAAGETADVLLLEP
jgi:molybdopterin molybdotransferase